METANIAAEIHGDKLYQKRARAAFPKLVRQAKAGAKIFYADLANELEMSNARNLNFVLGSIGTSIKELSKEWNIEVPPIQCIVVNKQTGLPGDGWFLSRKQEFAQLDNRQKKIVVDSKLESVFAFQLWDAVLERFSLEPEPPHFRDDNDHAAHLGGGPESPEHKRLKQYILENPREVDINGNILNSSLEEPLPSGDCADVFFVLKAEWIIVEAKSRISSEPDLVRGLYQCVKYKCILEAMQKASNHPQNARAILAIEGKLPQRLVALKNLLEVEVVELPYLDGSKSVVP